jgi:hypothetical protein
MQKLLQRSSYAHARSLKGPILAINENTVPIAIYISFPVRTSFSESVRFSARIERIIDHLPLISTAV